MDEQSQIYLIFRISVNLVEYHNKFLYYCIILPSQTSQRYLNSSGGFSCGELRILSKEERARLTQSEFRCNRTSMTDVKSGFPFVIRAKQRRLGLVGAFSLISNPPSVRVMSCQIRWSSWIALSDASGPNKRGSHPAINQPGEQHEC